MQWRRCWRTSRGCSRGGSSSGHSSIDLTESAPSRSSGRNRSIISLVDREAEPGFRSISVPIRRYDGAIIAAINMGAHVDRVSTTEMIDRFLPLLRAGAESIRSMLL